jgi:DNA-binding transcriptional ArsR family regulator
MKPIQVLRDPKAFQLLADETRRKILYLLRVKEMTVSQLAAELALTPQALYHHIKKLLEGEMVEVVREERIGHLIESYYRATAEDFLLSHGKLKADTFRDRKLAEEQVTAVLNALKKIGFNLEFDEKQIAQMAELRAELTHECCGTDEKFIHAQDEIWNMDELNLLTKQLATEFVGTLMMSDEEFAKQQETRKKLRDLTQTLVKK